EVIPGTLHAKDSIRIGGIKSHSDTLMAAVVSGIEIMLILGYIHRIDRRIRSQRPGARAECGCAAAAKHWLRGSWVSSNRIAMQLAWYKPVILGRQSEIGDLESGLNMIGIFRAAVSNQD